MKISSGQNLIPLKRLAIVGLFLPPLWWCAYAGMSNGSATLGWIEFTKKNYPAAAEHFKSAGDRRGLGMVALAQRDLATAQSTFEAAGDSRGLGLVHNQRRDYDKALESFRAAGDPSGCGLAFLGMRRLEAATDAFAKGNDWSGLGLVALTRKDIPAARQCFTKVEDHRGLGLCALEEEDFSTAEHEFRLADDPEGFCLLALQQGRLDDALSLAISQKDGSLEGMVYLAQGFPAAAEKAFTKANDANGLGDVYAQGRRFPEARAAFEKANNPVKVVQCYRNDYTLGDAERYEQAIAYGLNAAADGRWPAACLCEVADAQFNAGRAEEALKTLNTAAEYPGYAAEAALRRGRILFYRRDYEAARAAFQSIKPGEVSGLAFRAAAESLATLDRYKELNLGSATSF